MWGFLHVNNLLHKLVKGLYANLALYCVERTILHSDLDILVIGYYSYTAFSWRHLKDVNFLKCFSDTPETLAELGKIYYDLGYLTQSRQFHTRALELLNPDKAKLQVSLAKSLVY